MIEARGLTKRYGATLAVDSLSFEVMPGRVTGFLGPNGAGKSTRGGQASSPWEWANGSVSASPSWGTPSC